MKFYIEEKVEKKIMHSGNKGCDESKVIFEVVKNCMIERLILI